MAWIETKRSARASFARCGALLERHEDVALARHHHAQAGAAQPRGQPARHVEHEILLEQAARAARALVLAAVARVDHDRVEAVEIGGVARRRAVRVRRGRQREREPEREHLPDLATRAHASQPPVEARYQRL